MVESAEITKKVLVDSNGRQFIRLTLKDWSIAAGLLLTAMTLAMGAGSFLMGISYHMGDTQIHQPILEKQTMTRSECQRILDAHVAAGPHEGVQVRFSELKDLVVRQYTETSERLARIETKLNGG